jgi:hypothetical protein
MYVADLEGEIAVDRQDELVARLRSVRKGRYGAFVLQHDDTGPMLCVHMNNDVAYLWFVTDHTASIQASMPRGCRPRIVARAFISCRQTDWRRRDSWCHAKT